MNTTQEKVWNYLIEGGSQQDRRKVLRRLVERDFFRVEADAHSLALIDRLTAVDGLTTVVEGCCIAGIERFRAAILPVEENRKYEVTYEVTLTVEQASEPSNSMTRADYSDHAGPESPFIGALQTAMEGVQARIFASCGPNYKVAAAKIQTPEVGWSAGSVADKKHVVQVAGNTGDLSGHFHPKENKL